MRRPLRKRPDRPRRWPRWTFCAVGAGFILCALLYHTRQAWLRDRRDAGVDSAFGVGDGNGSAADTVLSVATFRESDPPQPAAVYPEAADVAAKVAADIAAAAAAAAATAPASAPHPAVNTEPSPMAGVPEHADLEHVGLQHTVQADIHWVEVFQASGPSYFWNQADGITTWTRPVGVTIVPQSYTPPPPKLEQQQQNAVAAAAASATTTSAAAIAVANPTIVSLGQGRQCAIHSDVDIKGFNIGTGVVTKDVSACCAMCGLNSMCAGFSWVQKGQHCWLKKSWMEVGANVYKRAPAVFTSVKYNSLSQGLTEFVLANSGPHDTVQGLAASSPSQTVVHPLDLQPEAPDTKHNRLFSEATTPRSDSTCTLPTMATIRDYPRVRWKPCNASTENPTFVTVRGHHLVVDCPGEFTVSYGDFRPRLIRNGTELFHNARTSFSFDVQKERANINLVRDEPKVKRFLNVTRPFLIPFNDPYVQVACPSLHSINIRTQYKPQLGRTKPTPRRSNAGKAYSIVHLKIDALSRPAFFRFMKRTASLFEKMWSFSTPEQRPRYRSFTFNRYVSEQMSTHVNMVPMFSGVSCDGFDVIELGDPKQWSANILSFKKQTNPAILPEWIWQVAHDNGFSVLKDQGMMLSHMFSPTFSSFSYRTTKEWEHKALVNEKRVSVEDGTTRLQDCWADEHFQEHYTREALQFLDTEPSVPKLILGNSKQAHEKWPYVSQYDDILFDFISSLMHRREDLIIIVAADHGYGYQDKWGRNAGQYPGSDFERLLPFLGLILPDSLLSQRPSALKHLEMNQERLVTHYDIHLTLLNLMRSNPLEEPATKTRAIPMRRPDSTALDLLANEIPSDRDCGVAGILPKSCVCVPWATVLTTSEDAIYAAAKGILYLNSQRQRQDGACKKIVLDKIVGVWIKEPVVIGYNLGVGQDDNKFYRLVRVEFTGTANTKFQFTVKHDRNRPPGPEEGFVVESQTMHRYRPLESCWDQSAPLKFCACVPQIEASNSVRVL